MKSNTCFNKKDGAPLSVYKTEHEAQEAANYANNTYDNNLSSYQCNKCNDFHLSPKDRQTPSSICNSCTGGDGRYKHLYQTKEDAKKRSDILYNEQGISLNVYQCHYSDGWHLTKQVV